MKTKLLWINVLCGLLFSLVANAQDVHSAQKAQVMLIGSDLPLCSSIAPENCTEIPNLRESDKTESRYLLAKLNINKLKAALAQQRKSPESDALIKRLQQVFNTHADQLVTQLQLVNLLNGQEEQGLFEKLTGEVQATLLDILEHREKDSAGRIKTPVVFTDKSKDSASVKALEQFVEEVKSSAGKEAVSIGLITAAERDPYAAKVYYASVFEGLQVKVVWLPVDRFYQRAIAYKNAGFSGCNQLKHIRQQGGLFKREEVYPDEVKLQRKYCQNPKLLEQQLAAVDGVFMSPGRAEWLANAFLTADGERSSVLKKLKEKQSKVPFVLAVAGGAINAAGMHLIEGESITRGLGLLINAAVSSGSGNIMLSKLFAASRAFIPWMIGVNQTGVAIYSKSGQNAQIDVNGSTAIFNLSEMTYNQTITAGRKQLSVQGALSLLAQGDKAILDTDRSTTALTFANPASIQGKTYSTDAGWDFIGNNCGKRQTSLWSQQVLEFNYVPQPESVFTSKGSRSCIAEKLNFKLTSK